MTSHSFELRQPPRTTYLRGDTASAPLSAASVAEMEVLGGLFRGAIRHLCFDAEGALLVLAGRGVLRLDPDTLEERGVWLPTRHVESVLAVGDRLWVLVDGGAFVAAFGEELGEPLAVVEHGFHHAYSAIGSKLALPRERGALLVDAVTGETREYSFDEAWFDGQSSKRGPDRTMLSPSGRYIGVTSSHGYTVIWEVESGEQRIAREHSEAMAIIDDRRVIRGEESSTSVIDFITGDWSRAPGNPHFDRGGALVLGDRLLAADTAGGFALIDIGSFEVVAELDSRLKEYGRTPSRSSAALSERHVATYDGMGGVLRVTALGGDTVESWDWCGGVEGLSVGAAGRRAAVSREWSQGWVECVDLDAKTLVTVRDRTGQGMTRAGITPDGASLVAPCGSILRARRVLVGPFGGAESEDIHAIKCCAREFIGYGDDCYAISTHTLDGAGYVGLHRAGAKRALAKVTYLKEQPWRIAVGADDDELLVSWDSATILYDMVKRPKAVETFAGRAGAVALGPRGFLAYVEGREAIFIRSPGAEAVRLTLELRQHRRIERLVFSKGGDLLMVGMSDGVLQVRRTVDGELLREIPLHVGEFVSLLRCGEAIWTLGDDGIVHIVGLRPPS